MSDAPVISREEVAQLLFSVCDILAELRKIRELLEDDNGEEVQEDLE